MGGKSCKATQSRKGLCSDYVCTHRLTCEPAARRTALLALCVVRIQPSTAAVVCMSYLLYASMLELQQMWCSVLWHNKHAVPARCVERWSSRDASDAQ